MGKRKSVKKSHLRLTGDNYVEKVLNGSDNGNLEKNDCAVRALSAAFEIPYWEAHRWLAKQGRRLRSGTPTSLILGKKSRVLFGHRLGVRMSPKKTVRKFLKQHPEGTFIVIVHRHAFCIKDGKIATHVRSLDQHIVNYWRVTKIDRKKPEENLADNKMLPTFEYMKAKPEKSIFDVHKERIRQQNDKMPKEIRDMLNTWNDPEVKHELKMEKLYEEGKLNGGTPA